ncbi:MAG: ATP synthase subunit I [Nocardioides sp.]
MTEQVTPPMTSPSTEISPGDRPSVMRVLRDQRKIVILAAALMVGTYWVSGQLGEWRLAACIAGGIALGLLNHLVTEYWLMRIITSGEQPTRNKMIASTMTRLLVLTAVAVGIAVMFWPDGIGLLLGLALFRLIALVMTGLPLLKELKKS